jgi:hypothetical protein
MTDTEMKPFSGYDAASSSFWVKGAELTVSRRWEREPIRNRDPGGSFSSWITGRAFSERQSVHVIGEEDRQTKEFDLTIKSDEDAKQEWEITRKRYGVDGPRS